MHKIIFLVLPLIGFREISFGQATPKTRYIDSLVFVVDSMKGLVKSISEGTIRKKYKSVMKNSFKKRPKGFFADWFYADPQNSKLLKVFSESSLTHAFTSYYFSRDSLIYVVIQKEKPAIEITDTLQKESYYLKMEFYCAQRRNKPN